MHFVHVAGRADSSALPLDLHDPPRHRATNPPNRQSLTDQSCSLGELRKQEIGNCPGNFLSQRKLTDSRAAIRQIPCPSVRLHSAINYHFTLRQIAPWLDTTPSCILCRTEMSPNTLNDAYPQTRLLKFMSAITNIAAYKFASLTSLKPLRDRLLELCKASGLKGTILLSTEGVNLFVAGERSAVDELLTELRSIQGLEGLQAKYSVSDHQPFHRMLVKIKREIIAFGVEGIDPVNRPAPKLAPRELKRWLDQGRPVTLLDTRNDYEVRLGTFRNAVELKIDHFREFPSAVNDLPADLKSQPIVMFCTGGIRCEKAGPYMEREGFKQIYQLDGGILKYFEECGGDHYDGECFVFDQRVGVDPALNESDTVQCFVCQAPLQPADYADDRFVEGESCPYCFQDSATQQLARLAERQHSIRKLTSPLPGSAPYQNQRPLNVPAKFDGQPVLDFLCGVLGHIPREDWKAACEQGRIRRRTQHHFPVSESEQSVPVLPDNIVRAGDRLLHLEPITSEPDVNADIRIVYEDEAILVIHKPAPLPMHPCGRFNRNTLQQILAQVYQPQSPRPAHRLDANTSGLVLFARTRHFAKRLQRQFESGHSDGVEKHYLARIQGHPELDRFSCHLPISSDAGQAGSREIDQENGLPAHTDFRVIKRFQDGTTLIEAVPVTGRTNQIRIHLWSMDHPICGDQTYLPERTLGQMQTLPVDADPLCLFAERIAFSHPVAGKRVEFTAEPPGWCQAEAM